MTENDDAHIERLHGEQLRRVQQQLLAALLRRPSLAPTVLRSGIRQEDFPLEWRDAFIIATKQPGRGREISGEEKGQGFYCAARTLVPDLKHSSSIVIGDALKADWGCVPWKDSHKRGLRFLSLAKLRELFDKKHGKQEWPVIDGEMSDWSAAEHDDL